MTIQKYKGLSAKDLLTKLVDEVPSFKFEAPINVEAICEHLKIQISDDFNMNELRTVGSIKIEGENPAIWINPLKNDLPVRRRFTIAHELAHGILHLSGDKKSFIDDKSQMDRDESYWDQYEFEANSFAAQLLMPASLLMEEGKKIIKTFKKSSNNEPIPKDYFIELMADKFKTSIAATKYRLHNLGLIRR